MNLKDLQKNWNVFGKNDPFWAILTHPDKKGRKWKTEEFFETGTREIDGIMKYAKQLNTISYKKALDFGCGVGRLTQALANYFDDVCGVDIAPSMIDLANRYNKYDKKCRYYLNTIDDLRLFDDNSFDFIYSSIVLQHMKPEYSKNYIKEFLRTIAPRGTIIFQMPSGLVSEFDSVFKANITPINMFETMDVRSKKTLLIRVKNISQDAWNVSDNIRLGNHWLDKKENIIILDDASARLTKDLMPGDEIDLYLNIMAPNKPEDYILELAMVKEGVSWFKDRGSATAKFNVKILYSNPTKMFIYSYVTTPIAKICDIIITVYHRFSNRNAPIMEIYGIQKNEILDLIKKSGGEVIDIKENYMTGKGWSSLLYCI